MQFLTEKVKQNILNTKINPELMLQVFENIAGDCQIRESPAGTLIVTIYKEGDLDVGDYAPELHFVVRKVIEEPVTTGESND